MLNEGSPGPPYNEAQSPGFDPLKSPSTSPSPAFSAYSYSSTSSADDLSDLEQDLNALSWEFIEEPRYCLTTSPRLGQQNLAFGYPPTNHPTNLHLSSEFSGTTTPVASRSSLSLKSLDSASSSPSLLTRVALGGDDFLHAASSPGSSSLTSTSALPSHQIDADADGDHIGAKDDGFDLQDADEKDMHADGIPAARGYRLDARQADTPQFRAKVLKLFIYELKLAGWTEETADPALWPLQSENLKLKRISGAFTNAVFFASYYSSASSCQDSAHPPTVLLRVYGAGSEVLLSRRAELLILHTLSSLYEIGPHILGTFANGRVEEFYDCDPIQKEGMRDFGDREAYMLPGGSLVFKGREGCAHWVARRMNELHSVPLEVMKTVLEQGNLHGPSQKGFGRGIENHIMASSHRPRRRTRARHTPSMPDKDIASSYALDNRGLLRASPAPMAPGEPSPSHAQDISMHSYAQRNSSTTSFDSLATSYNSQSSFSGDSPSVQGISSPSLSGSSATDTPNSYFPTITNGYMSPLALNPIGKAGPKPSPRGPYPGVWRRLKRWSREAAKVVELVEKFARTESGAKAVALCFAGHSSIRQEMQSNQGALRSSDIGLTPGNLRNTLRCIRAIDLVALYREIDEFKQFVRRWERREGPSRRVFAHNDAQYGNLLAIRHFSSRPAAAAMEVEPGVKDPKGAHGELPSIPAGMPRLSSQDQRGDSNSSFPGNHSSDSTRPKLKSRLSLIPPHHRIVVIDFEYASPNPRAYDIANHFQEWRADYHHPTLSWSLRHHGSYPDEQQRRKWLRAYVEQGRLLRMGGKISKGGPTMLEIPADMSLPPPVQPVQPLSRLQDSNMKVPVTAEKPSAPVTPNTGAAQVAALEKSSGERNRPDLPSISSTESGTQVDRLPSTDDPASRTLGRRSSNDSISSSSWQAPPSGPLRAVDSSRISAAAGSTTPYSPSMDGSASPPVVALANLDASIEKEVDRLEREVQLWSPATHAVWGLWGIVFAKEEVEAVLSKAKLVAEGQCLSNTVLGDARTESTHEAGSAESFDNLRYALGRIELFRSEFRRLIELGNNGI